MTARLTYPSFSNPDATDMDCPVCNQAVRVSLGGGDRLDVRCPVCAAEKVLAALDIKQVVSELKGASAAARRREARAVVGGQAAQVA